MVGRPPFEWTDEIESEIFERIAKGESARQVCEDDWLPSETTLYKRLSGDPDFAERYARARERQADGIFDEVQEIADGATPESVAVDRLRIDVRKWRAGKLRPKVYGDKLELEHGGAVKLSPVTGFDVRIVDAPAGDADTPTG